VLSSTYQTTHGPLLSTLYEPLPKHLISVLGAALFVWYQLLNKPRLSNGQDA